MKKSKASKFFADLSHEINNPNHSILLDAEVLEKAWGRISPLLEERFLKNGDFMVGGLHYSELKLEMTKASKRIIRNSRRIKQVVNGLDERSGSNGSTFFL
jgi:signal transduction histidine kinase